MNRYTKKALTSSIRHWQYNLRKAKAGKLTDNDISGDKCALCDRFGNEVYALHCYRKDGECCPVKLIEPNGCSASPWGRVKVCLSINFSRKIIVDEVKREIEFLKSLLPKK